MIFPATKIKFLMRQYYVTTDPTGGIAAEIHALSKPFIKTVAISVNTLYVDDLRQVGHLKLQEILVDHLYDLDRETSLYSYVWHTTRNAMISWCRREPNGCEDVDEIEIEDDNLTLDASDYQDIADFLMFYAPLRFESLEEDIARNACVYAYEATAETVRERRRGTKRTLISEYDVSGDQADLIISVVLVIMRMILLGVDIQSNIPYALEAIETDAQGLTPEICLLLGVSGGRFTSVFSDQLW